MAVQSSDCNLLYKNVTGRILSQESLACDRLRLCAEVMINHYCWGIYFIIFKENVSSFQSILQVIKNRTKVLFGIINLLDNVNKFSATNINDDVCTNF